MPKLSETLFRPNSIIYAPSIGDVFVNTTKVDTDGHTVLDNYAYFAPQCIKFGYATGEYLFKDKDAEVLLCDNFRDLVLHIDDSLNKFNLEPLVYTCYYQHIAECVVAVIADNASNILINTEQGMFSKADQKVATLLMQGRNNDVFKIVNEYDTVSEALESNEMMSYRDVLDSF